MAMNGHNMSDPMNSQPIYTQDAETSAQSGANFQYVSEQFPALKPDRKKYVFESLKEMFMGAIDEDTMLDVLEEKQYNFNESYAAFLELTKGPNYEASYPHCETVITDQQIHDFFGHGDQDNQDSTWDGMSVPKWNSPQRVKNADDSDNRPMTAAPAPEFSHLAVHPAAAVARNTKVAVKSESQLMFESILRNVQTNCKTLVILRGLPGSGKSFLANELQRLSNVPSKICSADSFFVRNGRYVFSKENISKAHQRCQKMALQAAIKNCVLIIIDNTNTQLWEMSPYVAMAIEHGYHLALLEPNTYWSNDPKQLAKFNVHGVPMHQIEKMMLRYEQVTVDQLILKLGFNITFAKYIPGNNVVEEASKKTARKPRSRKRTPNSDSGSATMSPPSSPTPEQQEENQVSPPAAHPPKDSERYVGFDEFCAGLILTPQKITPRPIEPMMNHNEAWIDLEQVPSKPTETDKEFLLISFDECETVGEAAQGGAETSDLLLREDTPEPASDSATCEAAEHAPSPDPGPSQDCAKLHSLFPQLSDEYLNSILAECHGNLDWAIDMLLESPMLLQDAAKQQTAATPSVPVENTVSTAPEKVLENTVQVPGVEQGKVKLEKRPMSKEAMELKRKLEQLVVLNQASPRRNNKKRSDEVASSSKTVQTVPAAETHNSEEDDEEEDEEQQFVEMPLEKGFAETLLLMFGGPPLTKMKDFDPSDLLVKIPVSVAHCLHFFWLETLQQNFDKREEEFRQLVMNDEKLAFEIAQQSDGNAPEEVPDLKEIMDMEMTLAVFRNEQKVSKTDIATNLTRQLLAEQFPKIDSQVLDSVFAAHGHNYKDTLDAIIASFGNNSSVCTVMAPEAIARCEKQLLEKARGESIKLASEKKKPPLVVEVPLSQLSSKDELKLALDEAQRYRNVANEHRRQRVQCFNKAENALRQGMPQVARYYSEMGQLHKHRMEQANGSAAACLFGTANADTLDLHYLYVAEALEVLDVFLDYHAEQMSKGCHKRKTIELVTGRGLRSEGGKPRIKPAVIRRLKERGLRFRELNPGSLCVFLTPHMMSSCK